MNVLARSFGAAEAAATQQTPSLMKAVIHDQYGGTDALRFGDVEVPPAGKHGVLVQVQAATICRGDLHIMTGRPYPVRLMGYGLVKPRRPVLGQNVAGRVAATGTAVSRFKVGDEVFGLAPHGGFAEYAVVPEDRLAMKPHGVSFVHAAALPSSGQTALQALRDVGDVRRGHSVLVNGGAGGVGTFAVQIARSLGAHVTAVCSTRNVERMYGLGADRVVDYTQSDFVAETGPYDLVLDLVGNRTLAELESVLTPRGTLLSSAGGPLGARFGPVVRLLQLPVRNRLSSRNLRSFLMRTKVADLNHLAHMVESEELEPVIEREYRLEEARDALEHVAEGHARGISVLKI